MKKQNLKNLALNKTVVSSLKIDKVKGGGETRFNTVCPLCNTDKDLCEIIQGEM
ncbi:MAG: hypothetical protein AAF611_21525 [Bacteroidota bacterium]